jgi:hypothetical protein
MKDLTTHPMVRLLRAANTLAPEGGPVAARCITNLIGPYARDLFEACLWALDADGRTNCYYSDRAIPALAPLLDQTDGVQVGFNGHTPTIVFNLRRDTPPADRIAVAEKIHRAARQVDPIIPLTTDQADGSTATGAGADPHTVHLDW